MHLGTQEYEVIAIGEETVRLFDPSFPLFNKELPRSDFDRMLEENALNDGLSHATDKSSTVIESVKAGTPVMT